MIQPVEEVQNLIGFGLESPADDYLFERVQSNMPLPVSIKILKGPFERFIL